MSMEVDYDKLIVANLVCQKWADHFETKANSYHVFIADLRRNPNAYLSRLSGKDRLSLETDLKTMFYAAEIENSLIIQYRPAIFYVIRRYRIKDYNSRQDLFDLGLLSLRYSVWRYRKHDCSFKTYAIRGLLTSFKGYLSDRQKALKSTIKNFHKGVVSLNMIAKQEGFIHMPAAKDEGPLDYMIRTEKEINFEMLTTQAGLTHEEVNLLSHYIDANNSSAKIGWRTDYAKDYRSRTGKSISKSGVSDKLLVIKNRLKKALAELKPDDYSFVE